MMSKPKCGPFDAVIDVLETIVLEHELSDGWKDDVNDWKIAIRVLEAAGKVDKEEALELISDVPRDERLYGEGFTGSGEYPERKQIRALLETLPDGGKK